MKQLDTAKLIRTLGCICAAFVLGVFCGRMSAGLVNYHIEDPRTVYFTVPTETEGDTRLNINTATVEELMEIPGIGELLAQRIVDFREQHGQLMTLDELMDVEGFGQKRIEILEEYVKVGVVE